MTESQAIGQQYKLSFRRLDEVEPEGISALVTPIGYQYPRFWQWLDSIFDERQKSWITGFVVDTNQCGYCGIIIAKRKPNNRSKICTFYVDPVYRGCGVGSRLLHSYFATEIARRARESYITFNSHVEDQIEPFLARRGFEPLAKVPNRYSCFGSEFVYSIKDRGGREERG